MDENLLFTAEILTLSGDLVFSRVSSHEHVIKNVACQGYITVSDDQLRTLYYFQSPKTVPAALEEMIKDRTCLALRDFYELVLKANRAGILRNAKNKEIRTAAVRWFLEFSPSIASYIGNVSLLAVCGLLAWRCLPLPATWQDLLIGWVFSCFLLCLGECFAAAVLRRAGGEVYHPRLLWRSLFPRLSLDLQDSILSHQAVQLSILVSRVSILAIASSALLIWLPSLAIIPSIALIYTLRPIRGGIIPAMAHILRSRRVLSTDSNLLFFFNRVPTYRVSHELRQLDWRESAFLLGFSLVWCFLLVRLCYAWLGLSIREAFVSYDYWLGSLKLIGVFLLVVLVGALLSLYFKRLIGLFLALCTRLSRSIRRMNTSASSAVHDAPSAIRENLLLRKLDYSTQQELAALMKPYRLKTWQTVFAYDEAPSLVGIILGGSITAFRRNKAGRRSKHMTLIEGDIFGVHGVIETFNSSLELRTNSPVQALVVSSEDFRNIVVSRLGKAAVYDGAIKHVFLRQLSFCAGWRPHILTRFTQITQVVRYSAGELIVSQGAEPRAFYLIFEGSARIMKGNQRIGRIPAGGFIGELGILQNSDAMNDVEAEEDTLCFVVNKVDFIRFITHNHTVAMQVERLASSRLGRPVFPMDAFSFDVQ